VDIQAVTAFFMWCSIINGGLLVFWLMFLLLAPDFTFRLQTRFFPMPRETYNRIIYGFLGLFKVFFLIFNLTPLISLWIIAT
tara:strand:- start:1644 stop:1889 length:246 start_codon:yes stop_codon:yes gene_type:complete